MDKVQVLARSRSDFAGGVDELTFRGTGTLEKTDYGYRLRYTAQNELDGSAVASAATACCWTLNGKRSRRSPAATAVR